MNAPDTLPLWAIALLVPLLLAGGSIILIGAFGLVRLPSFYQRIHAPAITVTLGTGCVLSASMLYFSMLQTRWVVHEVLIAAFVLMSAPVVSMLVTRAAVYRDLRAGGRESGVSAGDVYRFPESDRSDGSA